MDWFKLFPREERQAIEHCLAGGDSPIRDLVILLVDRAEMVETTRQRLTQQAGSLVAKAMVTELANARIEAYRSALMMACRLDKEAEERTFVIAANARITSAPVTPTKRVT